MAQDLGLGITISLKDQFSTNSKKVGGSMKRMRSQAKSTVSTMKRMQGAMQAAAGAAIFMAGRRVFGAVTSSAIDFGKGIAEVSTLVDTSKVNMKDLSRIAKTASTSFGISAVEQAAGLYQAISAGVDTSSGSLTEFMKVANQVAIGGVTDLNTSVDGLTTVMNAFFKEGLSTQQIADQMFATMKGGKTTIAELSRFMFQAAPISAAVGIKFAEVNAAIVALTKQGTPTSVAMTQIRSAIVGLTRPSDELNKIFAKTKERTAEAFIQAHGFKAALLEINKTAKGTVGGMTKLLDENQQMRRKKAPTREQQIFGKRNRVDNLGLLTGVIACSECGGACALVTGTRGGYYGCVEAHRHGTCKHKFLLKKSKAEKAVIEYIKDKFASDPRAINHVTERYNQLVRNHLRKNPSRKKEVELELGQLGKEISNLVHFITSGNASDVEAISKALKEREARKEKMERELAGLEYTDNRNLLVTPYLIKERLVELVDKITEKSDRYNGTLKTMLEKPLVLTKDEEHFKLTGRMDIGLALTQSSRQCLGARPAGFEPATT